MVRLPKRIRRSIPGPAPTAAGPGPTAVRRLLIPRSITCTMTVCLVFLGTGLSAAAPRPAPAKPGDPFPGPRGEVMLPSGKVLQVELADTPGERAVGYMFRDKVGDAEGMMFFFEENDLHSFWMKNCKVGLDLVWLDERWNVVHIERDVPPCKADPCPYYVPMQAARYVLETQAGLTAREKLSLGQTIIYVPPHVPEHASPASPRGARAPASPPH